MNTPLISIIVPIYKVEPYLRKCIDSILAQTYENIEIILVDDGSPDGCGVICDEYALKDSRVVVIHQENAGVSVARNAGLDIAKGEYVGFVDGDDWIEPDMYDALYRVITVSGADIATSDLSSDDEKPEKVSTDEFTVLSPSEAIDGMIRGRPVASVWGKLFSRKITLQLRFVPDLIGGEDIYYFISAIIKSGTVAQFDYKSYHYFYREDSASHAYLDSAWTVLDMVDMVVDAVREFDSALCKNVTDTIVGYDISCAKEAAKVGKFTKYAYEKVSPHMRKYLNRNSWKILRLHDKIFVCLLLLGRYPFIFGRKCLRAILKIKMS